MALGLFTLILAFSFAVSCPPSLSPNNHCSCSIETDVSTGKTNDIVECSNFDDPTDLRSSIREFEGLNIYKLKILDSELSYLPHDLFRGVRVEWLLFQRSSVMSFSDTDVAFAGLENSLKELEIFECDGLDSWDWSLVKNLRKMTSFTIMESDLKAIRGDIRGISRLNVKYVSIFATAVSHLDDNAFASFDKLRYISISAGHLREVKRSMLPNPANKLNTINLKYNELTWLPGDFFTNMPKLITLKLSGNMFRTLKEETFKPIWRKLVYFEAEDNQLICDCRLKWIIEKPTKATASESIECKEPEEFEGSPITGLQPSELRC